MPYPGDVAYRGGQAGGQAGFQSLLPFVEDAPSIVPDLPKSAVPRVAAKAELRALLRLGLRVHPLLRLLLNAYDLYQLYEEFFRGNRHYGFHPVAKCGPEDAGPSSIGTSTTACGATTFKTLIDINPFNPLVDDQYSYWTKPPSGASWPLAANYVRDAGNTLRGVPYGFTWPMEIPDRHLDRVAPMLDPWRLPIARPMWEVPSLPYWALPYRVRPEVDPDPSPVPSPRPAPRPVPVPVPVPAPAPGPEPGPRPDPRPTPSPTPTPSPSPDPSTRPPVPPVLPPRHPTAEPVVEVVTSTGGMGGFTRHNVAGLWRPPGKKVTEIKVGGRAASLVWKLANAITEPKDFLEALWDALPKRFKTYDRRGRAVGRGAFRSHRPPPAKMFKQVTNALRNMDYLGDEGRKFLSNAIANVAANQVQDYVFGKTGQAVARESRKSGRPVGYAAGPAL